MDKGSGYQKKEKREYDIVPYRPELKDQVLKLMKYLLGPDKTKNEVYWDWKFNDNPYIDFHLSYVALCKGKVVGFRAICGAQWEVGILPQKFVAPLCCDALVHPNHRGCGVLKKMSSAIFEDVKKKHPEYPFLMSLSAGEITYKSFISLGWQGIGFLEPMYLSKKNRGQQKGVIKCSFLTAALRRITGFYPLLHFDRESKRRRKGVSPSITCDTYPRPEAMAELVDHIEYDGRFRHVRDKAFFEWRFQNPLSEYRFLYWEKEKLHGFLILQRCLYRRKATIRIVDWEGENAEVRADLLRAVLSWGDFENLEVWQATFPDDSKRMLRENGFYLAEGTGPLARIRPTVMVKSSEDKLPPSEWNIGCTPILNLSNWDIRMIYSDGF